MISRNLRKVSTDLWKEEGVKTLLTIKEDSNIHNTCHENLILLNDCQSTSQERHKCHFIQGKEDWFNSAWIMYEPMCWKKCLLVKSQTWRSPSETIYRKSSIFLHLWSEKSWNSSLPAFIISCNNFNLERLVCWDECLPDRLTLGLPYYQGKSGTVFSIYKIWPDLGTTSIE